MVDSRYEIRVRGRMGKALLTAVPMLDPTVVRPQTTTVLRGSLSSQTELHEILRSLEGLGVELLEVRRLDQDPLVTMTTPWDRPSLP